jgi:hypothetical protein
MLNQEPQNAPVDKVTTPVFEEKSVKPETAVSPKPEPQTVKEDLAENPSDRPVFQVSMVFRLAIPCIF